jgi:hypothetical protein
MDAEVGIELVPEARLSGLARGIAPLGIRDFLLESFTTLASYHFTFATPGHARAFLDEPTHNTEH